MAPSAPSLPDALRFLWSWFGELSEGRGEGFSGPAPLTYPDISAWAQLTGRRPSPIEVRLVLAMDRAWRAEYAACLKLKYPKS